MKKLMLLPVAAMLLGACATPATHAGTALFAQTQQPVMATNAPANRIGRACATNVLGILIQGDMSIEAAKRNGQITQVSSVDLDIKSYAIYSEVCTIVTGR